MKTPAAIAILLLVTVSAGAQVNFAGGGAPPTMSGWGRTAAGFGHPVGRGLHTFGSVFLGDPWGYAEVVAQPAAPVVVVQGAPAVTQPREEPRPMEPLLIEWQGDHYARISTAAETATRRAAPVDYSESQASSLAASKISRCGSDAGQKAECQRQPTVLIYRDGHREKIAEYSIVGNALYASADFWSNGSWTRKIPLSALDIPGTIQANRSAGVKFELPSAPNVVIARF